MNTVCGTIQAIADSEIQVSVDRKHACEGCKSTGVCHGFTKTRMDLRMPRPAMAVHIGDSVIIAMENTSLIKACTIAFLIPLLAILAAIVVADSLALGVAFQALFALLAFSASLIIVRHMGRKIEAPRIIEVVHEE